MFRRISYLKKAGVLILSLMVAVSLSGCGSSQKDEDGPDSLLDLSSSSEFGEDLSSEAEGTSFFAYLSYAGSEYIDSGDEMETKLIRKVREKLNSESATEKSRAEAVIEGLKEVPDDLKNAETFVSDAFTVNSLKITEDEMVIDLSSDDLEGAGMYDEEFFIYQITDSMLNTFSDLESVRFTVDGSKKDSLNYIDISGPFTEESVEKFLGDDEDDETTTAAGSSKSTNAKNAQAVDDTDDDDDEDSDTDSKKSSSSTDSSKKTKEDSSDDSDSSGSSSSSDSKASGSKSSNTSSDSSKSSSSGSSSSGSSKSSSSSSSSSGSSKSSSSGSSSSGSSKSSSSSSSSSGSSKSSSSGSSSSGSSKSSSGDTSGSEGVTSDDSSSGSSSGNSSSGSSKSSGSSSSTSGSSGSSSSSSGQDGVVDD